MSRTGCSPRSPTSRHRRQYDQYNRTRRYLRRRTDHSGQAVLLRVVRVPRLQPGQPTTPANASTMRRKTTAFGRENRLADQRPQPVDCSDSRPEPDGHRQFRFRPGQRRSGQLPKPPLRRRGRQELGAHLHLVHHRLVFRQGTVWRKRAALLARQPERSGLQPRPRPARCHDRRRVHLESQYHHAHRYA